MGSAAVGRDLRVPTYEASPDHLHTVWLVGHPSRSSLHACDTSAGNASRRRDPYVAALRSRCTESYRICLVREILALLIPFADARVKGSRVVGGTFQYGVARHDRAEACASRLDQSEQAIVEPSPRFFQPVQPRLRKSDPIPNLAKYCWKKKKTQPDPARLGALDLPLSIAYAFETW